MKSSTPVARRPLLSRRTRTTLAPVGTVRFQEPCRVVNASTRSIRIEPCDRGPQRVAFIADIAGGPNGEIQLPVGSEHDGSGRMAAAGNVGHDGRRLTVARIESLDVTHFGDVHRVAT